jgi:hypothetical protein
MFRAILLIRVRYGRGIARLMMAHSAAMTGLSERTVLFESWLVEIYSGDDDHHDVSVITSVCDEASLFCIGQIRR